MKSLKSKLMAAGAMLMISAVMLTSASFAWFTVSTAPEISDIDVTMEATKNLEIAKATDKTTAPSEVTVNDSDSEAKWGAKVTSFTGTLQFPATVDSNAIKTVQYDAGGRTNGLIAATAPTDLAAGVGYYTADIKQGDTELLADAKVAAVFGVWLRSNIATDVTATVTDADGVAVDSKWGVIVANASGVPYASNTIALTADTATLVQVIIYVDGEQVKAADVDTAMTIDNLKVTFSSTGIASFATQHTP